MLKVSAVVLPCVFILVQGAAIGDEPKLERSVTKEACRSASSPDEQMLCILMQRAGGFPCTGSAEERLACLENKITKQAGEIVRLRSEVDRLTNPPRVRLLDERQLSAQ